MPPNLVRSSFPDPGPARLCRPRRLFSAARSSPLQLSSDLSAPSRDRPTCLAEPSEAAVAVVPDSRSGYGPYKSQNPERVLSSHRQPGIPQIHLQSTPMPDPHLLPQRTLASATQLHPPARISRHPSQDSPK